MNGFTTPNGLPTNASLVPGVRLDSMLILTKPVDDIVCPPPTTVPLLILLLIGPGPPINVDGAKSIGAVATSLIT